MALPLRKNRKENDWIQLSLILDDRDREKKKSEVREWNKLVDPQRLRKSINRLRVPKLQLDFLRSNEHRQVPVGFSVLTPVSLEKLRFFCNDLPFDIFENRISEARFWQQPDQFPLLLPGSPLCDSPAPSSASADPMDMDQDDGKQLLLCMEDASNPASMVLEATMPPRSSCENFFDHPFHNSSLALGVSPLHRLILFSIANNFAGIGSLSLAAVIGFLEKDANIGLYQLIFRTPTLSARAIVRNLFKGAIEAGNDRVLRQLLGEAGDIIDPDQEVLFYGDMRFTPIERACSLRHRSIIEVLLQKGVDTNKTYSEPGYGGALTHLINRFDSMASIGPQPAYNVTYSSVDSDIVQLLLDAGASSIGVLGSIAHERDDNLFLQIFRQRAWEHPQITRDIHAAILYLSRETCDEIVDTLLNIGVDINQELSSYPRDPWDTNSIIDTAVKRGDLQLIKKLVDNGANPTPDTLRHLLRQAEPNVLRFFLSRAYPNEDDILRFFPAKAVLGPEPEQILSAPGTTQFTISPDFLQLLVSLQGEIRYSDLGVGLAAAIHDRREDIIDILLDAGAELEPAMPFLSSDFTQTTRIHVPLVEALQCHDERLVLKLLDAGADPFEQLIISPSESPIMLAVKWGNLSIVQKLIVEAAVCLEDIRGLRRVLPMAVENGDEEIVKTLLDAGALCEDDYLESPLAVAVKSGNLKMTSFLLDHGANPNDQEALKEAFASSDKMEFQALLLNRYRKLYPFGSRGFGSLALGEAVLSGDEVQIMVMLKHGMDPTTLSDFGTIGKKTPFGVAIARTQPNRTNIVKMFLKRGCSPESIVSRDPTMTALLEAVTANDQALVELLIQSGANINAPAKGAFKRTALQVAAERGYHDMAQYLIHLNAQVNAAAAYKGGGTALQLAAGEGYTKIVSMLLCYNADVDAPGSKVYGRTALESAAARGRLDATQMLLNAGAGKNGNDLPQFERARGLARKHGHFEIVELLETYQILHADTMGQCLG